MQVRFILPEVANATNHFVYAENLQEIASLALASGLNVILSGPGGHGKSEFVQAVTDMIVGARTFFQSFGEEMDQAQLFGGLNLDKLRAESGARIEYQPEHSFLDH